MNELTMFDPLQIDTELFKIRSMSATTWEKLAAGILYDNSFHARMWGIKTADDVKKMYENAMKAWEHKRGHPIVFLSPDESEVYGTTNFMNVEPQNKMIEIGGSWIGQKWQRSFVNTGTKFELLKYVFETLKLNRIEFRIDAENFPSQRAVERLNFNFEGLHRRRKVNANGDIRDYKFYAVTDLDWPEVKTHILSLIEKKKDPIEVEIGKIRKLKRDGQAGLAYEQVIALIQKYPQHAGLQYMAASICDSDRTETEAVPFYVKALELGLSGVERRDAYLGLASTYRSLGQYQMSQETFLRGLQDFPSYRPYQVFLALTEYNLKRVDKSVSLLLKELVATTIDTDIKSYQRALLFYADRLEEIFE